MSNTALGLARRVAYTVSIGVVASVAAWNSYWHMVSVALRGHQDPVLAYSLPFSVDGMLLVSTLAMAEDKAHGRRARGWARFAFWLGAIVSVAANVASVVVHHGLDLLSIAVSAWPPIALLVVVEIMARPGKPRNDAMVPDPQQPPDATVGPVEPASITATQDHAQWLVDDPRPSHPASLDPTEVVAVTDILPAAISAAADLAVEGRPVSRETLSEKLREQGHAISTARASTLVKIVKALPTGTDPDSDAITVAEGTARPARPQARSRRATSQTDASRAETHPAAVLSGKN